MPQGDGTGPRGRGQMTGKRRGQCNPNDGSTPAQGQRGNASGRGQSRGSGRGQSRGSGRAQGKGRGAGQGRNNRS